MDFDLIVSLVGDLGAMGFILYLTHHLTTHTIPRLARQFEEAIDKQRADFKETLAQQRQDFQHWIEREQQVHLDEVTKLTEALKDIAREVHK